MSSSASDVVPDLVPMGVEGAEQQPVEPALLFSGNITKVLEELTISRSSTFREVSGSLIDAYHLSLNGEIADEFARMGIFPKILNALNAPQFNGRAARLTVHGGLVELRTSAMMALGMLTSRSLFRAYMARSVPGMVPCVVRILGESHMEDPLLATWGCGTLANVLQGCSVERKEVRDGISATLMAILRGCTKPFVFAAAVTAMRVFGGSHAGKAALVEKGLNSSMLDELVRRAREIEAKERDEVEKARREHSAAEEMAQEAGEPFISAPPFHLTEEVQLLRSCLARQVTCDASDAPVAAVDSTPLLSGTPSSEDPQPEFATTPIPLPLSLPEDDRKLADTACDGVCKPQYYHLAKNRDGDDFRIFCSNCAQHATRYSLGPQLFDNVSCQFGKCRAAAPP